MKRDQFLAALAEQSESLKQQGLYKKERQITSAQSVDVVLSDERTVIDFCANNYLGLADHPELIEAAKRGLDEHGFGMASVRFICGTQDIHKQLESRLVRVSGNGGCDSLTPPALTPTEGYSRRCSAKRTQ